MFTESVNESGGYVKFPYPYNGYMVIEYDPTKIPDDPTVENGLYKFELRFIRNPYADRINSAYGKQNIGAKNLTNENSQKITFNNT